MNMGKATLATVLAGLCAAGSFAEPGPDFKWPDAVVFISDDCSVHGFPSIFPLGNKRAYYENDCPLPFKIGRKLKSIRPAKPDVEPNVLFGAGKGFIGSPSVSYDGEWIYFSMAKEGDSFYHIYRISASGGSPVQLTRGPYHDLDPAELPDGNIVFSSTRIGQFDEYHSAPCRALFVMNANGSNIHSITHTSCSFDDLTRVMADGRLVFVRQDFFLDIGKEDVRLHAMNPDGTGGETVAGVESAPDYAKRHRHYAYGSPAPMPDGRLAFISNTGNKLIKPGAAENKVQVVISDGGNKYTARPLPSTNDVQLLPNDLGELNSLPDNRLICTVPAGGKRGFYDGVAVLEPDNNNRQTLLYKTPGKAIHSIAYLGVMPKPRIIPPKTDEKMADDPDKTGFMLCQNVRNSINTAADWDQVRAVRVLMGKAPKYRAAATPAVHGGNEAIELGTVPLAPDGSFFVEVPADMPIAFQMVDAEGRAEMNQMSWIYVRPGERKSCVGCHNTRSATPALRPTLALMAAPVKTLEQGKPFRFRGQNAWMGGMMDLQFERLRETASLDQHSLVENTDLTGQQELDVLVSWLKGPDAGLKISACQRLSVYHHRNAAEEMAELVRDSNREVRLAAILGLSACGTRDSVAHLLNVLTDPDPLIAQAAAVAVENLTGCLEAFDAFTDQETRNRQADKWQTWFKSRTWESLEKELIAQLEWTGTEKADIAAESFLFEMAGGKTHTLERFVIHNYGQGESGYNYYAKDFSVWVSTTSTDEKAFKKVLAGTLKPATGAQTFKIGPAQARYVRLRIDSGYEPDFIELGEFEAYSSADENVVASKQGAKLLRYSSEFPGHLSKGIWAANSIHDGVMSGHSGSWCSIQHQQGKHTAMPAHVRVRQRRAIAALGHIGGDEARRALMAYVKSQKNLPYVNDRTLFGIYLQADSPYNPRTQQEAIRALGHMQNAETIALLKEIVDKNIHHRKSNLFLSEICLEALGYSNSKDHEAYMVGLFGRLKEFHEYYNWYGVGTPNNEASTLHYRVLKYLDKVGSTNAIAIVPAIIRSLPIDPDRQLFMDTDDYETVAGRVIRRAGAESKAVETCLEIIGEPSNGSDEEIKKAVSKLYVAFGGNPGPKNRAAQVLSIVCRSKEYEPRVRAAFNRYRALPRDPLIRNLPFSNHATPVSEVAWVRYYLARLLGELRDPASSDSLIEALDKDPDEATWGRPAPNSLYVGMLQNEHTPCYRAAAARALGNIQEKRAAGPLLKILSNLDNALDTRYAAAVALRKIKNEAIVNTVGSMVSDYPDVSVKGVLLSISSKK